jgi:competence ComEA-like helix-hairpin-helix protein
MKKGSLLGAGFLILTILLIADVFATCSDGQIDINSAAAEELDQLYGIGPAKAQAMIDARPFSSVDDLIRVVGIGDATLSKIKSDNMACVANEKETNKDDEENDSAAENITEADKTGGNDADNEVIINAYREQETEIKPIMLNYPNDSKDIKSGENSEISGSGSQDKTAMYCFFVFSLLIGILLIIRNRKTYKNDI